MSVELTQVQKSAVLAVYSKPRLLVVMEPGMGKTLVFYASFEILKKKGMVSKALVFTHKRGLDAFKKNNFYGRRVKVIDTKADWEELSAETLKNSDVLVISTAQLSKYKLKVQILVNSREFDFVCIDEIHNYRVLSSKTYQALSSLLKGYSGRMIGMTATPLYTKLEDNYSIFSILCPGLLPSLDWFWDKFIVYAIREVGIKEKRLSYHGLTHVKSTRMIKEKLGYKNQKELEENLKPFVFEAVSDQFDFEFSYVPYAIPDEDKYADMVEGIGLAEMYKITMVPVEGGQAYTATKSQTEGLLTEGNESVLAPQVKKGQRFVLGAKRNVYSVVKIETEATEADYVSRLVPLQMYLSSTEEKYQAFKACIPEEKGCIVYFNYRKEDEVFGSPLQFVKSSLERDFPDRKIVVLTGGDAKLSSKVADLGTRDIVLMTRVASQSLDFYFDTAFLYDVTSNPGLFKQFLGRVTRMNAEHKKVYLYILYAVRSIEHYLLERLIYLIQFSPYAKLQEMMLSTFTDEQKAYMKQIASSPLKALKEVLLWQRSGKSKFKE